MIINKYFKYKIKYLKLKNNQIGGIDNYEIIKISNQDEYEIYRE